MKLFDQRSTLNAVDFSSFSIELLNLGKFETDWGFYSPSDLDEAYALFNATCGPASFSAIYRSSVKRVMRFFPHFPSRDWTTIGDMRKALTVAGLNYENTENTLPRYGLALLQLRVNDRPLHPLYSLAQTHWVAVCENCFYDANWGAGCRFNFGKNWSCRNYNSDPDRFPVGMSETRLRYWIKNLLMRRLGLRKQGQSRQQTLLAWRANLMVVRVQERKICLA